MACITFVSATAADEWRWLDENWTEYVCRASDLQRSRIADKTPHASGVYFLWDVGGHLLYVGQSMYLRERMYAHRNTSGAVYWSLIRIDGFVAQEQVEGCYIRALKPPMNKGTRLKMWPGHTKMVAAIRELAATKPESAS